MKRYIRASIAQETIDSKLMAPYKGYNVEKSWTVDRRGRTIKDSVRYAVIDADDDWIGDMYKTVKEAHDYIDSITKKEVKASSDIDKTALNARLGDTIYDSLKERYGEVIREGQSGNYDIIYVDFNDGSKPLKINVMNEAQRIGRFHLVKGDIGASTKIIVKASHDFSEEHDRTGLHDFYDWYDSRPYTVQMRIDDMADDMGLPEYDECSTEDLDELRERYIASRKKK